MNWSIWAPGAFDYSADKARPDLRRDRRTQPEALGAARRLFPDGRGIELQQLRYPGVPAAAQYVARTGDALFAVFAAGQAAHHRLGQQRQFRQLSRDAEQSRAQSRHRADPPGRTKYGYVINLEQAVTDDIGLFGRWSWNDGKTEIMSFTDIDASPVARHVDQGQQMGPAGRHDRHRRRDQRPVARSSRLPRRRRPRPPDRRRPAQLPQASASSRPITPTRSTRRSR